MIGYVEVTDYATQIRSSIVYPCNNTQMLQLSLRASWVWRNVRYWPAADRPAAETR